MGKYLTETQRYQLEVMLQDKIPVKQIAERLGKCVSTIYNEIKRGQVEQLSSELVPYKTYKADYAHRDYLEKQTAKGADFKIGNDFELVEFIENKIINEKSTCTGKNILNKIQRSKDKPSKWIKSRTRLYLLNVRYFVRTLINENTNARQQSHPH